ncbi:hypothetical protein JG688_00009445 [Phytophthora aleatoria]|uniref:Uncharacterized protein n=1 Tax=Phytophthora aleatoria TaxID=2496075 RepID=A0A8J5MFY5_9STRA|nr:hypothetical protein JG688_00009445 [Phytophthora aleatoria]
MDGIPTPTTLSPTLGVLALRPLNVLPTRHRFVVLEFVKRASAWPRLSTSSSSDFRPLTLTLPSISGFWRVVLVVPPPISDSSKNSN